MAPLSLFRLRKYQHRHHQQQQRRVVEPLSPASFFTPERSPSPSIDAADITFEVGVEPTPEPNPEPEHEPPQLLEGRSAIDQEIEREGPSAVPVSASASAFDFPGPPDLALSIRFSFDAQGSLGDSIERYFLSSHPDIDISRAGPSAPALQTPTISIVSAAAVPPIAPAAPAPAVPIDPIDLTFRTRAGADRGTTTTATTTATADQPQLTNNDNVNINRVNSKRNPTVSILFVNL